MTGARPATQFLACWLAAAGVAAAQTVDLQSAPGRRTIDGHVAGAAVGSWLHTGDLTGDYWTKELIVGSPDEASGRGTVRLYIGTQRVAGDTTTATADVVINGASAGDRFGAGGDAGYVTNREIQLVNGNPSGVIPPRDLLVGAPGALSGRGILYVFAGPFSRNTPVTVANAVARITGAPGDNLGSQVESADLNGDGFREVILPVPSRGIVYVVDVHNAASSSIDLSVAVPGTILTGLGSSIAVAAGDMTGDGLIDLAVGTPDAQLSRGVVYLLVSRSRVLPTSIALPTGADAQITGEEPGDQFGASLWVADIDDDGDYAADLLVGAPGADGPANTRTNAGAVYVVWGRSTLASTFQTGLVLHGAAAGHRLGTVVTSGNVTRRNPHDVVALAPGANGGSGEIFLYYGRHVFEFPSSGAADLATAASRRVVSDETAGAIRTVRAWEATGEGAEEIVAGVPSATTVAGGGAGRLYIALSPRLELSTTSVTMRVAQCVPGVQELEIRNPSVISIPWQLYDPPSWAEIQPATGTTVVGSAARVRLVIRTSGMTPGTYSQQVIVRSAGPDVGHAVGVNIQLTVDPPAAFARNANVDFNGDGCGDPVAFNRTTGSWRVAGQPDRLLGTSGDMPTPGDYNGDGLAELAVFRPSTATWVFEDGTTIQYGAAGDIPVPADYDGDGRLDLAVYSPKSGTWSVRGQPSVQLGGIGDLPVPGDYNGDGRAEFAVYRRSTGEWLIHGSPTVTWGSIADLPVPADYDGDGVTDIAVYARSTGTWRVLGQFTLTWGQPSDIPVPFDVNRDGKAELVTYRKATGEWLAYDRTSGVTTTTALGGAGTTPAGQAAFMRLFTVGLDFDDEGRSDVTVWRPSTGFWFVKKSGSNFVQWFSKRWGDLSLGDQPVPADYDGDGVADIAVWRESTGVWFVSTSSSGFNQWFMLRWGIAGDQPVPGDYDGDGKADIAVWRPTDGIWYIKRSTTSYSTWFSLRWGTSALSDVPVPADFDGDGATDIVVWRPGTGMWYVKTSSSGYASYFTVESGGGSADIPVASDFDGDGRADAGFWRPETGVWHVKTSGSSYTTSLAVRWGAQWLNDVPVAADFDGDGRTDITVWRPSTGVWYVLTSASEYRSYFEVRWGLPSDAPLGRMSR